MMQSVAFTESYYLHDDDYVVVEIPPSNFHQTGAVDTLAGIDDECGDGDDDDDLGQEDDQSSYDYCDDVVVNEKIAAAEATITSTMPSFPVNINLSFVVNDDDASYSECPPSLSDEADRFEQQENHDDNLSDLSSSLQEGSNDEVPTHVTQAGTFSNEVSKGNDEVAEAIITSNVIETPSKSVVTTLRHSSIDEKMNIVDPHFDSNIGSSIEPSQIDTLTQKLEVVWTEVVTKNEEGSMDKGSRLSNKKRRKQLKLAKRAAATAAATTLAKLSAPKKSPSLAMKTTTRRSGKQVVPITPNASSCSAQSLGRNNGFAAMQVHRLK
jgi:hypothetical protein